MRCLLDNRSCPHTFCRSPQSSTHFGTLVRSKELASSTHCGLFLEHKTTCQRKSLGMSEVDSSTWFDTHQQRKSDWQIQASSSCPHCNDTCHTSNEATAGNTCPRIHPQSGTAVRSYQEFEPDSWLWNNLRQRKSPCMSWRRNNTPFRKEAPQCP